MDLSGQRFLAYLEEDNTQRVLFRVRPLLSPEGLLAAEDIAGYRDQGFLRIAPDRQEQHTFKERMRELGGLCVLDLREAAQGKVRLNRNYAPGRGESNRYIVYSDAIKALPEDLVYEVVSKEDSRTAPLTPRYYVRSGGFINGPFPMDGETEGGDGASQALPPDCDRLFLVTMPDKQHRLFYWPEEAKEEEEASCCPACDAAADDTPLLRTRQDLSGPVRSLADLFFRRRQPQALSMAQDEFNAAVSAADHALRQAGFDCGAGQAAHLLLLSALFSRFQLASSAVTDAVTAGKTLAALLGISPLLIHSGDAAPAGAPQPLLSPLALPQEAAPWQVIVSQSHSVSLQNAAAYALSPWPVASVEAMDLWPQDEAAPPALSLEPLRHLLRQHQGRLSAETENQLSSWHCRLKELEAPLPLALRQDTARYLRHAQAFALNEEIALGFAVDAFILPYALSKGVSEETLSELFAAYPEALKRL